MALERAALNDHAADGADDALGSLRTPTGILRGILDLAPGGIVHVDLGGAIRGANAEARRLLGLRFDSLAPPSIADLERHTILESGSPCPPSAHPVAQVLATGRAAPATTLGVLKADGSIAWALVRAAPLDDDSGRLTGAIATLLDVTERRRVEEELKESELKWRSLAENLPDFVVIVDATGRFLSVNRTLPHLDEGMILGARVVDFVDPASRGAFHAAFEKALGSGQPVTFENRGEGEGHRTVLYETTIVPLGAETPRTRALVVARDITERRAMLARLAANERLASVGMLAASVSHEIMNPLAYVIANLELTQGDRCSDDERRKAALAAALDGAKRMQQIVRDLRALGRSGSEQHFYLDPRSVIETAIRLSAPLVSQRARVVVELGELPNVCASESQLCQVFINLLVNAAEATRAGCADSVIWIRSQDDETSPFHKIDVADRGEGIAEHHIRRVFEPFYTTKPSGTGLGLWLSRDILRRVGGDLECASPPGGETVFTVKLPKLRP